jgi:ATP-dependent DNA ligase
VAKKRSEPYRPGERGWVKVKHRHYWRFGQELNGRDAAAGSLEPMTALVALP